MNLSHKSDNKSTTPLLDKHLLFSLIITVFTSAVILYVIKTTERNHLLHLSYFVASMAASLLGVIEPRKGWLLAIAQVILLLVGYYLISPAATESGRIEIEHFGLYGAIILTFIVSLLGGFVKRALSKS
ncbi:hypothetical protein [Spirosoma sp. KUDC1026]|uniref:hypothetical protein n=1 Tax=Spirosoma sp. KUDC1026 TaxID=2745947 RepID=UPI00159BC197|nr:hypothetical protein [Spirosoma sp. KUDC1026]QKZ15336.1 hypothetical protein HU175_23015 [Spirosoma sp. KUDC1026]